MYSLRGLPVWLSRIRYCRGFGVQSPWVYSFIRDVINERHPYYCYEELKRQYPDARKSTRKLCELYFRIANFRRAAQVMNFMPQSDIFGAYISAGCRSAEIVNVEDAKRLDSIGTIELAIMSLRGDYRRFYKAAKEKVCDGSILIVQDIKRDREAQRFWKRIVADRKCTITLDLYYCGIIYFDSKRYKQKYIVNF